jgi:hypothetical protein
MLQRFAQLRVAFLDFLEQPDVFDRNHRLAGEGLEEHDFLFGEGTNVDPTDGNRADYPAVADHRHTNGAAEVEGLTE